MTSDAGARVRRWVSVPNMTTPDDRPQDRLANPAHPPANREMPVIRVPSQQDLPVPAPAPGAPPLPLPASPSGEAPKPAVGVFSDVRRSGRWRVEPRTRFVHVFGDAVIDLREADFLAPTIEIETFGLFGDTKLIVTPGTEVDVQGTTIFGDQKVDQPSGATPDGRRVRLTANGAFGDVKVHHLEPGEALPKWWKRKS